MKTNIKRFGLLLLFSGMWLIYLNAQQQTSEVVIKTSAQCQTCKSTIEKNLTGLKGILSANLDLATKNVKVVYSPEITNPDKIREAISKIGYDADNVKADPTAYQKLPTCCQKPDK